MLGFENKLYTICNNHNKYAAYYKSVETIPLQVQLEIDSNSIAQYMYFPY